MMVIIEALYAWLTELYLLPYFLPKSQVLNEESLKVTILITMNRIN